MGTKKSNKRKMLCAVAGITADANSLINYARNHAQQHLYTYNEDIQAEQLVQTICDLKQGYTQFGGLRPFGVSMLYASWDNTYGFQLYHSDPSGNYAGWKANYLGSGKSTATSMLKSEYKVDEPMSMDDAWKLTVKVLTKTLQSSTLSAEKCTWNLT